MFLKGPRANQLCHPGWYFLARTSLICVYNVLDKEGATRGGGRGRCDAKRGRSVLFTFEIGVKWCCCDFEGMAEVLADIPCRLSDPLSLTIQYGVNPLRL